MNKLDFPALKFDIDENIVLRQLTDSDADAVFASVKRNEGHLMEFMHWMTPDYSLEMAREFVSRSSADRPISFGMFRNGEFIGSAGFVYFDFTATKTEIGYWIDFAEEGKGIVSRAVKHLIDFAFGELEMNRIEIRCSSRNKRSAAIPKRFGFKLEGHLRQTEQRNGELHDFLVFGLLRSEWRDEDHA